MNSSTQIHIYIYRDTYTYKHICAHIHRNTVRYTNTYKCKHIYKYTTLLQTHTNLNQREYF